MPVASSDGNMWTARSGKYTDVAALVAFLIERAALGHVMRDVGDVDAEPVVAVRQLLDADRVVEVARVLAVDRHRDRLTEIGAAVDDPSRSTGPNASASSIAASPCTSGMPYLRMMISVSTPCSLMSPSTSTTLPTGPRDAVGHVVISTTTISPGSRRSRLAGRHVHVGDDAAIERLHEAETGFRRRRSGRRSWNCRARGCG